MLLERQGGGDQATTTTNYLAGVRNDTDTFLELGHAEVLVGLMMSGIAPHACMT